MNLSITSFVNSILCETALLFHTDFNPEVGLKVEELYIAAIVCHVTAPTAQHRPSEPIFSKLSLAVHGAKLNDIPNRFLDV